MTAFDTDILTRILLGDPTVVARLSTIPQADRGAPVVAVEEMLRGRLNTIRRAEAGHGRVSLERAYELFQWTLKDLPKFPMLAYDAQAHSLFEVWRQQRIRVGTKDLRIAAICVVHGATLATRNQRDYGQVPGLLLEIW